MLSFFAIFEANKFLTYAYVLELFWQHKIEVSFDKFNTFIFLHAKFLNNYSFALSFLPLSVQNVFDQLFDHPQVF